jgi:hypothetical protein
MTRLIQLLCVLLFLCGCASDSHHSTEPIDEKNSAVPPNYYGTWQWPNGGGSSGRAGNAGSTAVPQAAAANAEGAASPVGVGSAGADQLGPGQTIAANTAGVSGSVIAAGGQPNQAPSSSGGGLGLTTVGGSSGSTLLFAGGGLAFGGTASNTTAFAGSSGSASSTATGGASSGVRVVFESKTGTTTDSTIATVVRLENKTNTSLPLGAVSVSYWAYMSMKQIECFCDTAICTAAKVGTFRTSRRGTNTCIEYTFTTGYSLDSGKSIQLVFNCHYIDDSLIDETTHYSQPYRLEAGDEMPNVTVEIGTVVAWGVEPQW